MLPGIPPRNGLPRLLPSCRSESPDSPAWGRATFKLLTKQRGVDVPVHLYAAAPPKGSKQTEESAPQNEDSRQLDLRGKTPIRAVIPSLPTLLGPEHSGSTRNGTAAQARRQSPPKDDLQSTPEAAKIPLRPPRHGSVGNATGGVGGGKDGSAFL